MKLLPYLRQVVGRYGVLQNDSLARVNAVASEADDGVCLQFEDSAKSTETRDRYQT